MYDAPMNASPWIDNSDDIAKARHSVIATYEHVMPTITFKSLMLSIVTTIFLIYMIFIFFPPALPYRTLS